MNWNRILTYVLLGALIASIGGVVYLVVTPQEGEHFTEFYILGPGGMATNYPTDLVEGEKGKVIAGVSNHEWEQVGYRMKIVLENNELGSYEFGLEHGENWTRKVSFKPGITGENLKLQFLLFRDENQSIYRELHLWIDVHSYS